VTLAVGAVTGIEGDRIFPEAVSEVSAEATAGLGE
jgi:hypothetical protein